MRNEENIKQNKNQTIKKVQEDTWQEFHSIIKNNNIAMALHIFLVWVFKLLLQLYTERNYYNVTENYIFSY